MTAHPQEMDYKYTSQYYTALTTCVPQNIARSPWIMDTGTPTCMTVASIIGSENINLN